MKKKIKNRVKMAMNGIVSMVCILAMLWVLFSYLEVNSKGYDDRRVGNYSSWNAFAMFMNGQE